MRTINSPDKKFTDADDAVIRTRALDGWSGSQIAAELGRTRNSVIGRAHRMKPKVTLRGLNVYSNRRGSTGGGGRPRQVKPKEISLPKARPVQTLSLVPVSQPADDLIDQPALMERAGTMFSCDDVSGLTLLDLRSHQCRWEVSGSWDASQYRFCGKTRRADPKRDYVSYCPEHDKASTRSWTQAQQEFAEHKAQHMRDGKKKHTRWGKAV